MKKFISALAKLKNRVIADFEAAQSLRAKYEKGHVREHLSNQLIKDIGVQSMAAIRLMQFANDVQIPYGGVVVSKFIRSVFNMEIHWNAKIDPGIMLIHGVGLVVGEHTHLSANCLIAHNVTIGESLDSSAKRGGPTLENNVHVGPGANIIGPITIGENSKIMAGVTVTESVPPNTLVGASVSSFHERSPATNDALGSLNTGDL